MAIETRQRFLQEFGDGRTVVLGTHFAEPTAGILKRVGEGWVLDAGLKGVEREVEKGGRKL